MPTIAVGAPAAPLVSKDAQLDGHSAAHAEHAEHVIEAMRLLEAHAYDCERLKLHQRPLDRAQEAPDALASGYQLDRREVLKVALAPPAAAAEPPMQAAT